MRKRPIIWLILSGILFVMGFACVLADKPVTAGDLVPGITQKMSLEMATAFKEANYLAASPDDKARWLSVSHSFFLIDSLQIKAWSKNDFVPDIRVVTSMHTVHLLQGAGGDYLLRKWTIRDYAILVVVIPLRRNFDLVNNYLGPEWNSNLFDQPVKITDVGLKGAEAICLQPDGCLFSVEPYDDPAATSLDYLSLTFFLMSIISLAVFVGLMLMVLHKRGEFQKTFIWLAAFLVIIRIVLVELNFPNILIKFHWFDPKQFASSSFNASIGDLLINSLVVLALCLYLFTYYTRFDVVRKVVRASGPPKLAGAAACLLIAFFALLLPYLYGEIMYHNSSISLEITSSLSFESSRILAFISILIGSVCGFLVMHVCLRLAILLCRLSGYSFFTALIAASAFFIVFFVATGKSYWVTVVCGMLFFAIAWFFGLVIPFARLTFRSFLYFLIVVIVLACQGTLSVSRFHEEKQVEDLFRYGSNFLVDQDVLGEYLLNESLTKISNDAFIQLRLSSPFLSKVSVRQKIKLFYLSGYFDRYDVQVYLYNSRGEPYENVYSLDFSTAVQHYQNDAFKTIYPGIYFVNNPSADVTKKYLAIIPVRRFGIVAGYAVLDLTLKKIIPQNVYPELLVDNRFSQYIGTPDISYAWYSNGRLTGNLGQYNYEKDFNPAWLKVKRLFTRGLRKGDVYHTAIEDNKDRVVVVSGKRYPVFDTITNFSFFFILGLVLILAYLTTTGIVSFFRGRRMNYSSRIQLYVYLAFFFPLFAVSITTLSLMTRSNKDRLIREYGDKANMLSERIATDLQQFQSGSGETQSEFQNRLIELAKLANADASVYVPEGSLLASSQPAIYENHLVSHLISRPAWMAIATNHDNNFIDDERIGKLQYSSAYAAIKSPESGKLLGILSIPFFSSAASLEQSRIAVLANILTVFAVIFILFSFLSFFVARVLTFPLRFITQSLQKTSLTGTNPLIAWNSRDEIGLLASEYNRMVRNLEDSKANLLRSQKESAWREIAKQVAHEIKNPLTPMKLTLQQWERSLADGTMTSEKAKRSIALMLVQLETLNDIAGSFSAFARMPAPVLQQVEMVALLRTVAGLYAADDDGKVVCISPDEAIVVSGDEHLLSRIFSNLILNGLQSGRDGDQITVTITIRKEDSRCIISVGDNGQGIDQEVQDRVFVPHFSTKKSGSGLGLAIVRQGIEQCGGEIWFETEAGKGTTFYVAFGVVQ